MKKRLFALLLAGLLAVSAAGCADKPDLSFRARKPSALILFIKLVTKAPKKTLCLKLIYITFMASVKKSSRKILPVEK